MTDPTLPPELPELVARLLAARAATAAAKAALDAAVQAESGAYNALQRALKSLPIECYVDVATGTAARIDRRGELELFPVRIGDAGGEAPARDRA
jgi:hypothetical protein